MKTFEVFGEPVHVLVTTSDSRNAFSVVQQVSPPGGGPPPHVHSNEDEIFTVIEGEYEIFDGEVWHPLAQGETAFMLRGQVHTFRNRGTSPGRLQAVAIPGNGFEDYLEAISALQMPQDMARLFAISEDYGIRFITAEPPTEAPL